MDIKQEFTAFGFSIEKITIIYGAFLIFMGTYSQFCKWEHLNYILYSQYVWLAHAISRCARIEVTRL